VLRHLDELRRVLKGKFAGQGSLEVFLKELAIPATPMHEGHINPPAGRAHLLATIAKPLAWFLWR
jgi:hypothetical protein